MPPKYKNPALTNTNQIKRLQTKLKDLGLYSGNIDGIYGPLTEKGHITYNNSLNSFNVGSTFSSPLGTSFRKIAQYTGVPLNTRQFVADQLGSESTLDETDLTKDEFKALQNIVRKNLAAGKNTISYKDYATGNDVGGNKMSTSTFVNKLADPYWNLKTTLGQASINVNNGDTTVTDQYNFNDQGIVSPVEALQRFAQNPDPYSLMRTIGTISGSGVGRGSKINIKTNEPEPAKVTWTPPRHVWGPGGKIENAGKPKNVNKSKRARLEEYYNNPNVQAYLAGIRFTETGGTDLDWTAKNPKSTARGPYQFLDRSQKDILNNWGVNAYSKDPKEVHLAALGLMAYKPEGLESIKKGDFKTADALYNTYWTSLPGGAEPNVHTPKLKDVRAQELQKITKPVPVLKPAARPVQEPSYWEEFMSGWNAPFNDPKTDYNFPSRVIGGFQELMGVTDYNRAKKQQHGGWVYPANTAYPAYGMGGRLTEEGKEARKRSPRTYNYPDPSNVTSGPIEQRGNPNLVFGEGGNTAYESWYRYNTPEGREGIPDSYSSYDYQRYYNDAVRGLNPMGFDEGSQHFPDTYKYPWHPSFSDESIYYINQKETPALSYNTKADFKEYTRSKRAKDYTKYADGGPIEPYNISDPAEFKRANQAYQDSLNDYNKFVSHNKKWQYIPVTESDAELAKNFVKALKRDNQSLKGWYYTPTKGSAGETVIFQNAVKKPVRKPVYTPKPEYNIIQHSEPMGPQNMEMPKLVDYIMTPYGKISRADYEKQFGSKVTERDLRVKKADGGEISQAQQEYINNIGRNAATGSVTPLYGVKDPIFSIMGGLPGAMSKVISSVPTVVPVKPASKPESPKVYSTSVPPPHKGSELRPELEPYISSRSRPATKDEQIFESFLSPQRRWEKQEERTTYYDYKGNVVPRPKKEKGGKVTWQIIN